MWRLSEIKIRNIVSFHEATWMITQGVATLIFGKNEDNASQPCNGSGKSSLIEAISFAFTGEQLRKVKSVEEIINDHADEAYVYMKLDNDFNDTVFTIERTISRNAPQTIECHKYDASGMEIERDKTIQPTVSDYNKFILNEIGLSKDDIYNNFILCDNKYESFFDCSDKSKKEVINRFSNGVIIDESIARVQNDMEPILVRLNEANNQVTSIKGSISAIEIELTQVDQKKANAKEEREARIARLDGQIQKCREDIEVAEDKKSKGQVRLQLLQELQENVASMEDSDMSLLEAYQNLKSMCQEYELGTISEYDVLSEKNKQELASLVESVEAIKSKIKLASQLVETCKEEYSQKYKLYETHTSQESELTEKDKARIVQLNQEVAKFDKQLDEIEAKIKSYKAREAELDAMIARSSALMDGVIICPKCEHKFFVGNTVSVEEVRANLIDYRTEVENNKAAVAKLNSEFNLIDDKAADKSDEVENINKIIKSRAAELNTEYSELVSYSKKVDEAERHISSLQRQLSATENDRDRLNGKIEIMRNRMFGEISGILEGRIMNGENYISQLDSSIKFSKGQMAQYQQSKRELLEAPETDFAASLKVSLKKYQSDLAEAESTAFDIQSEYNILKEQEVHFTMFKSHIARKKIDALSLVVNDFLEKIGSDIRLKLEGFTVTKTGKLRDKISVQVMRDGIDCGSYHKFSGGEKARLNLACILSLHTLTNSNCEDGKGLDFIIIDELLDKSDEMGMATYCEALNKLGQTALLITQGGVSEGYPHKLLIVKKQGISTISN